MGKAEQARQTVAAATAAAAETRMAAAEGGRLAVAADCSVLFCANKNTVSSRGARRSAGVGAVPTFRYGFAASTAFFTDSSACWIWGGSAIAQRVDLQAGQWVAGAVYEPDN